MKFCIPLSLLPVSQYVPLAQAAEECGWEAVSVSEHVVNPEKISSRYPYTEDGSRRWEPFTDWPDPWVTIGALASVTSRLRFFTNVYVLPLRPPFTVAKSVGTAAVLSGGRVALGVGMGWMADEFELLEQRFEQRGRRADEMIEVLRKLWGGGWAEHHGTFYDFDRLEMSPAPGPDMPVPIYVGGVSEPALRRAARNDGWISDLQSFDELTACRQRIDAYRAEYGREDAPFDCVASCRDVWDYEGYRRLEDAGVTHLLTHPWVFYTREPDLQSRLDGLRRFTDDILSRF